MPTHLTYIFLQLIIVLCCYQRFNTQNLIFIFMCHSPLLSKIFRNGTIHIRLILNFYLKYLIFTDFSFSLQYVINQIKYYYIHACQTKCYDQKHIFLLLIFNTTGCNNHCNNCKNRKNRKKYKPEPIYIH